MPGQDKQYQEPHYPCLNCSAKYLAAGVGIGGLWFITERSRTLPLSGRCSFYFDLYTEIGGVSGLFARYIATLVKCRHVHLGCACSVLAIPFFLVFLLALIENHLTAVVVIVLFVLAVIP